MSRVFIVNSNNILKEVYRFQEIEENGVKALANFEEEESEELYFFKVENTGMFVYAPRKALESIKRQLKKIGVNCFFYEADQSMVDDAMDEVAATHLYTEDGVYYQVFWF